MHCTIPWKTSVDPPASVHAPMTSTPRSTHWGNRPHLDALKTVLGRMEAEILGAMQGFSTKVLTYAAFHYKQAQVEAEILPKASEVLLSARDWDEVAAAFAADNDPMLDKARRKVQRAANGSASSIAAS